MKRNVLLIALALSSVQLTSQAQNGCGNGRYQQMIFTDYTLTSDVVYGQVPGGGDLLLDVYEPTGDQLAARPLIVLAHGGSFIGGSKTEDPAVTKSCIAFAKMGYVCASINYTLGFDAFPPNAESAARTVYRTARQMKTAVRFFRKDAATANLYKVNPDVVFIGGNSAGAITALHAGYLDTYAELPAGIDTSALAQGAIEGYMFGHPGYSDQVSGIINMAGAIGDVDWLANNTIVPVVSAHGTVDQTVPYGSETIVFLGAFPVMPVEGSGTIHTYAQANGMNEALLDFVNEDHVPWNSDDTKMTQVINFNRDFLYNIVCVLADVDAQNMLQAANIFPNPADDLVTIQLPGFSGELTIRVTDLTGKTVYSQVSTISDGQVSLNTENLSAGMYALEIRSGNYSTTKKLMIGK
jgi:para-nitrobenzyl esterase